MPDDDVELPGHPQIEQKRPEKVCTRSGNRATSDADQWRVLIDDPVENQLDDSAHHPVDARLVDLVAVASK